nr:hypothetical protein [uncultured Duganella sp.]
MNSFYLAVLAILVAMLVLVGLLYAHRKARALVQLCLHAWDAKRNAPAWCALLFQLMRSLDGLMRALLVSSILAIALVLLLTVNHYQAPPPLDGPRLPVPSSGKDATALWLTALVMLAGVVLLWARSRLARGIGAVALLCGLFNGYLFKDVKIEQLAKLEFKLDKLGFTFTKNEFNSDVKVDVAAEVAKQLADFAPELFEPIAGFKLG